MKGSMINHHLGVKLPKTEVVVRGGILGPFGLFTSFFSQVT